MYATSLISGAVLVLFVARSRRQRNVLTIAAAVIATALLEVGIGWIEEPDLVKLAGFWSGFGLSAVIFTAVALPFVWKVLDWKTVHWVLRAPLILAAIGITITDGISMFRPIYQVAIPANNIYILNEMLAQAANKIPDSNFMPLYEHMYGWLLKPFAHHFDANTLTAMACIILSVCSMLAVFFGVLIAYRALGRRSLTMAVLLVVPLACVTTYHNPLINLAGAFQDLPVRIFPGMLMGALGIEELLRIRSGQVSPKRIAILGAVGGLAAWSDHDFAVESVFVLSGLLLLSSGRRFSGWNPVLYFGGGLLLAVLAYPVVLALSGDPISLKELFYFQSLFGHGFGEYPIQIPGPVMFVLPLIIGSAAVGSYVMWQRRGIGNVERKRAVYEERAALTAAYFGIWSIVAFTYYMNRSIASGQLQIFLLPTGVAASALAAMGIRPASEIWSRFRSLRSNKSGLITVTSLCGLLPVTVLCSLPLASSLQTANPGTAVRILVSPPSGTGFAWPPVDVLGKELKAFVRKNPHDRGSVSYFGPWSNYVTLVLGIPTVTINDVPPSDGTAADSLGCDFIRHHRTRILVLDSGTVSSYGPNVCDLYHLTKSAALAPWSVYAVDQPAK
jgi:hypothetical protein